ncbi:hypothetical protein BS50DRAFT_630099 [Corynespora cassiicola Philippines]|uniref:Uncharacterized protein n=1 Tax=Corynespora cassiicola Philippines TaxID=1448308 RepID=A0A2T2P2T1_CORCC|nr:hypothetical protein BS50DRAFT_630099 [Corynespora cassiicola Philippines]
MVSPERHTSNVKERMKHPRLKGADIYVGRFGRKPLNEGDSSSNTIERCHPDSSSKRPIMSLHDELSRPDPELKPTENQQPSMGKPDREPVALPSRPCYRCVAYMNSVRIKRVFWTNEHGNWECAKVRDPMDALDNICYGEDSDKGNDLGNMFVTKHEVSMLRRTMGNN